MGEIEDKEQKKSNKAGSWFIEYINKVDNPLARLIKMKKIHLTISGVKGITTKGFSDIKRIYKGTL